MPSQDNASERISVSELTTAGMLCALALALSWVESIIPFQPGLPGVKLGLANLVIVFCLYRMRTRTALLVNVVRIMLAGFLFNGVWGTLYSLAGGVCSFAAMVLLLALNRTVQKRRGTVLFSIIGVSMTGGVFHNLGQLIVAMLAISNLNLIYYGAALILSGTATGILNGVIAHLLLKHVPNLPK